MRVTPFDGNRPVPLEVAGGPANEERGEQFITLVSTHPVEDSVAGHLAGA